MNELGVRLSLVVTFPAIRLQGPWFKPRPGQKFETRFLGPQHRVPEPVPSLETRLKGESVKGQPMGADTSVVKKKHEWNPIAGEEEWMENTEIWKAKGRRWTTTRANAQDYQSQS